MGRLCKGPAYVLATEVKHLLGLLDASDETAGNGQPAVKFTTSGADVSKPIQITQER